MAAAPPGDPGRVLGRGISFPPRVGADGRVAWSEGNGNVREAIQVVLRTDPRERMRLREFGTALDGLLFEPNITTTRHLIQDRIVRALQSWEPRIAVESVSVREVSDDPESALTTIEYRLVATETRERVSLSIALAG